MSMQIVHEGSRAVWFTTAGATVAEPHTCQWTIAGTDQHGERVSESFDGPPPVPARASRMYAKILRGAYHTGRREAKARRRYNRAAGPAWRHVTERAFVRVNSIVMYDASDANAHGVCRRCHAPLDGPSPTQTCAECHADESLRVAFGGDAAGDA